MSEIVIAIIVGLVMLIGLIGAIIPGLPDIVLIWGASLGYGLLAGWGERGIWLFALITLIGLAGLFAEVWVSGTGAKIGGASIRAIFGGLALGLAGFIFSGPIGGVIGLLLGTFLSEYIRLQDANKAAQAMFGMGLGCGASLGIKLLLGMGMIALWLVWVFSG
ncbi:MAG: hypothetical protein AMJ88_10470 [Anaerolineae bacterium SM23_ 63]|nr:MAG: hypothetical protein AMJ88_10470 [Anaerolineae bacterium SM23_ 63]HEY47109.1 DUF456 domain-containing protein [Anaerolineae bacterium]